MINLDNSVYRDYDYLIMFDADQKYYYIKVRTKEFFIFNFLFGSSRWNYVTTGKFDLIRKFNSQLETEAAIERYKQLYIKHVNDKKCRNKAQVKVKKL